MIIFSSRWLTNKLLAERGEVLFLDLDPGQKEFGLPGYLSLALMDKPLLGSYSMVVTRNISVTVRISLPDYGYVSVV